MKKIALLVVAFCFTIGMACAQEPKKPATNNNATPVAAPAQHQGCNHACGGCPRHAAAQQAQTQQPKAQCQQNEAQCQQTQPKQAQPKANQAKPNQGKPANAPKAKPTQATTTK